MSRRDEDRILHGLYYYRESLDEEFTVTCDQILWLASHSYAEGVGWHRNGDFLSVDSGVIPAELRKKLLMSKCELPLRYLHYRRLIKFNLASEETMDVAVTFAGADRAMRLHTRLGRMDLWYHEHRNGFLGLVTTIAVSIITTLATVYVTDHVHKNDAEPTRISDAEARPMPDSGH